MGQSDTREKPTNGNILTISHDAIDVLDRNRG